MLTIRKVKFDEVELLRELMERTFRNAFEAMNEPVFFKQYCDEAFAIEEIVAELTHPESEFWFAFWSGELAGYLKLNYFMHPKQLDSENTLQVERLYLLPEFQNKKIGQRLLQFAENRARKNGSEWVWLSVWQENPAALRFYERNGFEIFGTEVFDVGTDPQIDWLVRKATVATKP